MGEGGSEPLAVLGAGPAGLTAGYVLARSARPVVVFEAGAQVGGLARTVVRDGYRFDLGGHRFFTKSAEVQAPLGRDAGRGAARARAHVADLLARALHRLPAAPRRRRAQGRTGRARALREPPTRSRSRGARCAGARPRRSRSGSATASGGACSSCSSRATPRRSGACRRRRSAPSGPPSGSARCRSRASCAPRCCTTAATCAASSSSFTTRGSGPGQMWEAMAAEIVGAGGQVRLGARVDRLELARRARGRGPRRRRTRRGGGRHLVARAARRRRARRSAARPRQCAVPPRACATATSSPSRSSSRARTCSPTTGSTSTTRTCGSAGSRTSARGARRWCPTPAAPAWGWSTSASRATRCGTPATTSSSPGPRASSRRSGSRRRRAS